MNNWVWYVTTWGPNENLDRCLASIGPDEEAVVIDTKERNWSVSQAWNYALREGLLRHRTVIVANDDIVVRADTGKNLDHLLHNLAPLPKWRGLVVTAYDVNLHGEQKLMWQPMESLLPGMFCWAAGSELVNKVGMFDEQFEPAFFEDTDMMTRIKRADHTVYSCTPVHHIGEATTKRDPEREQMKKLSFSQNWARYREKWGGDPGRELYPNPR